jgi:hypothetical protein
MLGPWVMLPVGPAAPTTVAEEDVDDGPLRGAVSGSSSTYHRC